MQNWKKWINIILISSLIFIFIPEKTKASKEFGNVSAKSAILIEQKSGRILYEKDAYTKRRIASITKIMTAIIAIESGKMNQIVTVSPQAVRTEGSSIYLKPGEKISLEHLVYGLMLRSGNDAAVAIAEHVGGSLEGFVMLMNQKAEEIGMSDTSFANPHGLDDHLNHYSTAYDMAKLTRYAMQNETFREIFGAKIHRAPNPSERWDRVWKNKNKLLTGLYSYCTGGKTGYTKKANRTLVSTATKNGLDLIAVTLDAPDDWNDHIQMYETAFDQYKLYKILKQGTIKGIQNKFYKNKVFVSRNFYYPLTEEEEKLVKVNYTLIKPKRSWKNSKHVPAIIGKVTINLNDETIGVLPLYFDNGTYERPSSSFLETVKNLFLSALGVKRNG
jgi:serine-type D-Ala-D-Ala carboxypeptidase (penicillin-binding protein 5/6)